MGEFGESGAGSPGAYTETPRFYVKNFTKITVTTGKRSRTATLVRRLSDGRKYLKNKEM